MSDIDLVPKSKESVELLEEMVDSIPTIFPKAKNRNNYTVFGPVANQQSDLITDIHDTKNAKQVLNAKTIPQLKELGKLVDTYPKTNEPLENYRVRVLANYRTITNEATPNEIIETSAYVLQISPENVKYGETDEPGIISIGVQKNVFDESLLTQSEISELLTDSVPAGYSLIAIIRGTFEYISPSNHNDGNDYPETGYSGLDSNGDPTGVGGTYSEPDTTT